MAETGPTRKGMNAAEFLGKHITVQIDRAAGSPHPRHGYIYPVNYGFVPGTLSGDGEEVDAYVLGVTEPLTQFTGRCIALIHRTNDDDDKLIVVPDGLVLSVVEIRAAVDFQERYFESQVVLPGTKG